MKKKLILLLASACVFLGGCSRKTDVEVPELLEPVGINMDTVTVIRGDFEKPEIYEGSVVPSVTELCFSVDGKVDTLTAYQGKWVDKGETLVCLDQKGLTEEIENIELQLEDLRKEGEFDDRIADLDIETLRIEHQQVVNAAGYWSDQASLIRLRIEQAELEKKQTVDNRNETIRKLETRLEELNGKVTDQTLSAPHAGHVYFADTLKSGAYVRAGKPVVYITDPTELSFRTSDYISDSDLERNDHYLWIEGKSWECETVPLDENDFMEAVASGKKLQRNFNFKDKKAAEQELEAGMFGVVFIKTNHLDDVLLIPENAVKSDGSGAYVYVIENGSRVRREIETGARNGVDIVIKSGLSEGEVVYVQD